jgi:UDP-3-O-[3-hydroxymyristoyl] glucosamine N-acyltransferase
LKFTAEQIAGILEGTVVGDPNIEVHKLSKIEEGTKGSLSFLSNLKYTPYIYTTEASVTIVNSDFEPEKPVLTTLIKVEDAYEGFSKLLEYYNQIKLNKFGLEQPCYISESTKVPDNIYVGAFAYIGNNVEIGENVKIFPNAYVGDNVKLGDNTVIFAGGKVYSDCIIGDNCVINSGAIIGADGFGFAPSKNSADRKCDIRRLRRCWGRYHNR